MSSKKIDSTLKEIRVAANKTVLEVSEYLTSLGYKASEKTIYSWESGRSRPTIDIFLDMCMFYGVKDIFSKFGNVSKNEDTKNSPSTDKSAPGDQQITLEKSNSLLLALGLIEEGQELSSDDLAFLNNIIGLLNAWFGKGKR